MRSASSCLRSRTNRSYRSERASRKGAPNVETPRGASLRRRPRPCSLRRPAGAPWHLGSSSPPRRRPTGRLYSGGPDGIATFETPSWHQVVGPRQLANRWLADFEIGVDAVTGSVPDGWQIVEVGSLGKAKLTKARQIKQGMMQELLTGGFAWYEGEPAGRM